MDDGAKTPSSSVQTGSILKDEYLEQSLEDAARMIRYASDGKISDPSELKYIQKLVKITELIKKDLATQTLNGEDLAEFYSSLAIMSHLLFPVTMESLRKRERITKTLKNETGGSAQKKIRKRLYEEKGLLFFMVTVLLFALMITPFMASYSLTGSDIVTRLDKNIKDLIELKKDQARESVCNQDNEESDPKKNPQNPKKNTQDAKRILINDLYIQLDRWNNNFLGYWVSKINKEQDLVQNKVSNSSESTNDKQKSKSNQSEGDQIKKTPDKDEGENKEIILKDDDLKRMQARLPIKSKGIIILQTVNQVILPLLFGFCGTAVFLTRRIIQSIQSHTYTGVHTTTFLRVILGSFCGFFLGYLGSTNELVNLLTFDVSPNAGKPDLSLVSPLTLAFVGGYSVDILVSILNRFIYAVTNDDKYLPTSEMINKKVDPDKLLPKG